MKIFLKEQIKPMKKNKIKLSIEELSAKKNKSGLTKEEEKELSALRESLKRKSQKSNKIVLYIMIGVAIVGAITACILSNCLSTKQINQIPENKHIEKIDVGEFVKTWNKKIYQIKYDNLHLKIDFKRYELNATNAPNRLSTFLSFSNGDDTALKHKVEEKKLDALLLPFSSWLNEKEKVHYVKSNKAMNSNELMKSVAKSVSRSKSFSNNTIDKVIQLNEFCYYFEKQKDAFYRDGYTKNVKSCDDIQKIRDKFGFDFSLRKH